MATNDFKLFEARGGSSTTRGLIAWMNWKIVLRNWRLSSHSPNPSWQKR